MNHLCIFGGRGGISEDLQRKLSGLFRIEQKQLNDIFEVAPGHYTVFDIDLNETSRLVWLKEWLKRKPSGGKAIFLTDRSGDQEIRARAIGATDVLTRPADGRALLAKLWGDVTSLAAETDSQPKSSGVVAAVNTLQNIFSTACLGEPLEAASVQSASDAVVGQVETQGLAAWIETVRTHHSQTYQHCLLVTGLAVAFGQQLGVSRADRQRLSFAGMLHDIGKARIPLAILEKPGPLDREELAVMRKHPLYGLDALASVPGLAAEMLDLVVHHHEYIDGSGYPHGLCGSQISDLARIITIADIFGALIERRSYKKPMSSDAAYQVLHDMGPKLDRDLVREFRFVSQLGEGQ